MKYLLLPAVLLGMAAITTIIITGVKEKKARTEEIQKPNITVERYKVYATGDYQGSILVFPTGERVFMGHSNHMLLFPPAPKVEP